MTMDRRLFARYMRQRRELGETELFLEAMTRVEAVAAASASSAMGPSRGSRRASPSSSALVPGGQPEAVSTSARPASDPQRHAEAAAALRVLGTEAAACTRCRLHEGRRSVVFGEGNPGADLVVVGEAPGGEEDRTGRPFVGPAGKLLDLLLLSVGFPREAVYICNVLKCRPPRNRDPQPDEVEACSRYLHAQLERIAPRVLLAVGRFSAQMLSGSKARIGELRGRVHAYRGIAVVATYHPAFLLRSPQWTRATWRDFQLARRVLEEQA